MKRKICESSLGRKECFCRLCQLDTHSKHFKFLELFATAVMIKKVCEGQHSDAVVLVTCSPTSIIHDQVKEGNSIGLDCAAIKDVNDLSNIASCKTQVLCA